MKSVDWHAILDSHPLFQSLDRQERKLLVSEPFSKEHKYREGSVILEEGETGNSLFLIGAGAVSVVLHGLHDEAVKLYTLREGELFGEMALIEQRPRSATVVAAEPSTVLELNGDRFLPLMQKHHEIALYLLAKLSQRLRHIDDEILIRRVKGLDETLNILNNRVDAIVQATDAKLAASQAMFDETNQRAHEIIDSAERARSRLGWALGFASSVLSLLVAIGVWNHMATQRDVKDIEREVKDDAKQVADMRETVQREAKVTQDQAKVTQDAATRAQDAASKAEGSASKVEGFEKTAKDYTNKTATLSKDVAELHKKSGEALDGIMFAALQADIGQNKVNDRTVESYTTTVSSKHKPIQDQLFETMHDVILGGGASTIKDPKGIAQLLPLTTLLFFLT
jgi:CRP-like cAMP-binding protein